jgi:hypothetical protein
MPGRLTSLMLTLVVLGGAHAAVGSVPTYTKDVAPILLRHCAACHADGDDPARVALLSYARAVAAASSIREQVAARTMPPWSADPAHSLKFRNDAQLSDAELGTLLAWIDGGTPEGDAADLPAMSAQPPSWQSPLQRPPDAIVALPELRVAASGEIPYIQQLIKVPAMQDQWIAAMQLRAGNRRLLHHMAITEVRLPEGMGPKEIAQFAAVARSLGIPEGAVADVTPAVVDVANANAYDMLGVYTPGSTLEVFAEDSGKLLKAGKNYYLNFNIHYSATGKPESDRSQLALWFRPTPPRQQLFRAPVAINAIIANGSELLTDAPGTKAEGTQVAIPPIAPYARSYELIGMSAFTQAVTIFQLQPHAHMRAHDFRYGLVYPDGHELTLLTVPAYDFHWQLAYELEQPLEAPAGSKLIVTAHYDNSQENYRQRIAADDPGRNCGPENLVYFRRQNQTWDEMFSPLAQYAVDAAAADTSMRRPRPLQTVQVVGCLVPGRANDWQLRRAGKPAATESQASSSTELQDARALPLGTGNYALLGTGPFDARSRRGHKVAVKGVLIEEGNRINVTSLQTIGTRCP